MEPCGTPQGRDAGAEQWSPIITAKHLLERYDYSRGNIFSPERGWEKKICAALATHVSMSSGNEEWAMFSDDSAERGL